MATTLSLLVGANRQQKREAPNFEAFMRACPNFAGRAIASLAWGGDPPDVLCLDGEGARIGIELVEWVNEEQIARSKTRHKLEDSYKRVIRSWEVEPPADVGLIFIYPKDKLLAQRDATQFRKEIFEFVGQIDAAWRDNPDRQDPQGCVFSDFVGCPCLTRYLDQLIFHPKTHEWGLGADWLTFEMHGGPYTPDWMRDALLESIGNKIAKYSKSDAQPKLAAQTLSEFYLLAYYDEAVIHNTPYHAPGFGILQIATIVHRKLTANSHPFDRVFLFVQHEPVPVLQVWPTLS